MQQGIYSRPALIQWGAWGVLTGLLVSVIDRWVSHGIDSPLHIAVHIAIFVIVGILAGPAVQHVMSRSARRGNSKVRPVFFVGLMLVLACILWIVARR